jgi:hypothetical protein
MSLRSPTAWVYSIFSVRVAYSVPSSYDSIIIYAGVFENILGLAPQTSMQVVSKTTLLPWILKRIEAKNHEENRGYAAEILSILLQDSRENRLALGKHDGVDTILRVLSVRGYSPTACHAPYDLSSAISTTKPC